MSQLPPSDIIPPPPPPPPPINDRHLTYFPSQEELDRAGAIADQAGQDAWTIVSPLGVHFEFDLSPAFDLPAGSLALSSPKRLAMVAVPDPDGEVCRWYRVDRVRPEPKWEAPYDFAAIEARIAKCKGLIQRIKRLGVWANIELAAVGICFAGWCYFPVDVYPLTRLILLLGLGMLLATSAILRNKSQLRIDAEVAASDLSNDGYEYAKLAAQGRHLLIGAIVAILIPAAWLFFSL